MTAAHLSLVENDGDSFADELPPGTELLQGQYRITRFLSAGGFGITYLAKNSLDRNIVIKECFPAAFCRRVKAEVHARSRSHHDELTSIVRLFVEEARSLAKLVHPNIVGVHQVFEENNTAYMSLDFIEGRDLLETLDDTAWQADPAAITAILRKLLDAIGFVHAEGMLHRDISPDNVLIQPDGEPILIDFGAAREQASKQSRVLSALRVVKDGYSPQEFYISGAEQGPSSDLYALGATLYHVLTRELPPDSQTRLGAVAGQGEDPYVSLVGRVKGYDRAVLTSIDQALALMPRDRLQSAQDWLDVLDRKRGRVSRAMSRTISAAQANPAQGTAPAARKKSRLGLLLGSAAAIAVAGGIAATQFGLIEVGMSGDRADDAASAIAASTGVATTGVLPMQAPPELAAEATQASGAGIRPAPRPAPSPAAPPAGEAAEVPAAQPAQLPAVQPAQLPAAPQAPGAREEAAAPSVAPQIGMLAPLLAERVPTALQDVAVADAPPPVTRTPPARAELAPRADSVPAPAAAPPRQTAAVVQAQQAATAPAQALGVALGAVRPRPRPADLLQARASAPLGAAESAVAAASALALGLPLTTSPADAAPQALTASLFATPERAAQARPGPGAQDSIAAAPGAASAPVRDATPVVQAPTPMLAAAPQAGREIVIGEDVTVDPSVSSAPAPVVQTSWSVDLPFAIDSDVPVTSVNGVRIDTPAQIEPVLREMMTLDGRSEIPVIFGVRNPSTGAEDIQMVVLPVVQKTVLGNGMTFESRFDGEVWKTTLADLPADSGLDLRPGDHFVAHLQSDRMIDGETTLGDIVDEGVTRGTTTFSFAVSRNGQMWVSGFRYEPPARNE